MNAAKRAIDSVRQHLPDAQIVLSTHDELPEFDLGEVIFVRAKPARQFSDVNGNWNNVNKLISSVASGLECVTREFCIKLRTDHFLTSDAVLGCIQELASKKEPAGLFLHRIGVSNLFLRNPCKVPYLFHLTDTLQFGRTDDLRSYWGGSHLGEDFVRCQNGPRTNPIGTFQGFTSFRLLPEQALFLSFAQRKGLSIDLKHISHTSFELFCIWERLLSENFEVYDWQRLGVQVPERFLSAPYAPDSLMTEHDLSTLRTQPSPRQQAMRYADLLINKYLLCWFRRRWLVSIASLLLFSLSSEMALYARGLYRRLSGAHRA